MRVTRTMLLVRISKPLWQKLLNWVSHKFMAAVSEHSEYFCIQLSNLSGLVGENDANGHSFDERAKVFFGALRLFNSLFEFCAVHDWDVI